MDEQLAIIIDETQKRSVRIRAAELGISMGEATRRALTQWLKDTQHTHATQK